MAIYFNDEAQTKAAHVINTATIINNTRYVPTNNGSDTLTAACLVDGDMVQCIPLGRTTSRTKRQRQEQKLKIAVTKRKGLAAGNTNANYYRALNTKAKANLPTLYKAGDNVTANRVDNANSGGLVTGRPWT